MVPLSTGPRQDSHEDRCRLSARFLRVSCSAPAVESQSRVGALVPAGRQAVSAGQLPSPGAAASAELEVLFWRSIVNSTDPADFEAYLEQFPERGLPSSGADPSVGVAVAVGRSGWCVWASGSPGFGFARLARVFRDCEVCPEMVVMEGGRLALGRYEVTVREYRAFASATGGAVEGCGSDGGSWEDPGFRQTDRHPVTCVSWDDAQAYVSWLSRTTGTTYRLPTEAEWELAAAGSQPGCSERLLAFFGGSGEGTCPVGFYGANAACFSDMVGNVWEWTLDCFDERQGDQYGSSPRSGPSTGPPTRGSGRLRGLRPDATRTARGTAETCPVGSVRLERGRPVGHGRERQ